MKNITTAFLALVTVLISLTQMVGADPAAKYSWQQAQAKVSATGDLEWAPKDFVFKKGASARYIDFENGNDTNDGTTIGSPWKHHPWDANATGNAKECTGIQTYVFKGGVTYRGRLLADKRGEQSGRPGNPVRLTCDPSWGKGKAILLGSTAITSGWKKCADGDAPAKMPETAKVWYIDLDQKVAPQLIWEVRDGNISRIPIARSPNWTVTNPIDPQKDWWTFTGSPTTFDKDDSLYEWSKRNTYDPKASKTRWLADEKNLTNPDPEFYVGATIWSEYCFNMGTPHRARGKISKFNAKRHGLQDVVGGIYPYKAERGNRYFIEDLPQFLDAPGEYYFDKDIVVGRKETKRTLKATHPGRLYIRLPEDRNPNESVLELGTHRYIIDIRHQHDVEVSGLRFRFNAAPSHMIWPPVANHPSAVRIVGMCKNITVANNTFEHLVMAVTAWTRGEDPPKLRAYHKPDGPTVLKGPFEDVMENIVIRDNDIAHIDDGALWFRDTTLSGTITQPGYISDFRTLHVMRNRLFNIGMRQYGPKQSAVSAISIHMITQAEVAGNIIDRSGGAGINIWSAKHGGGRDQRNRPMNRTLVYHNKVTNSLLSTNDYGGIEIWQGGPTYVFNNVSGNALGRRNYSWFGNDKRKKWSWINWGFAYYADGMYKSYTFNNIAWGRQNNVSKEWAKGTGPYEDTFMNMAAFCDVIGFQNHRFNNTAYKFALGLHLAGSEHSRNSFLGNVLADTGCAYVRGSSDLGGAFGEIHSTPMNLASTSYAHNVYHGVERGGWPALVGRKQWKGKRTYTLKEFQEKMAALKMRTAQAGVMAEELPLKDPDKHDYRLKEGSPAINAGVKFFVPWSLTTTVGEWNFYKHPADPGIVVGENFFMSDEYIHREMYNEVPWNNLKTQGVTLDSYATGDLEDWTPGALNFDGTSTYCVLADKDLKAGYEFTGMIEILNDKSGKRRIYRGKRGLKRGHKPPTSTYPGKKRRTVDMDTNNFLIEVYFKTKRPGSVLVSKLSDKDGYMLDLDESGQPRVTLRAGGHDCSLTGGKAINDGKWHHVIAEVDRASENLVIYVDGKKIANKLTSAMPDKTISVSNTADLLVGKGPSGKLFAGAMDFLRICRGTLADSETSIEELYAWQFDGPQTRDFTGRKPTDGKRDAGAIEYRP